MAPSCHCCRIKVSTSNAEASIASSWVGAVSNLSISVNPTDPSGGIEGVAGEADVGVTLNETVTDSTCMSLGG